jgi:DNA mismatch endonuclease (patch repair protein)
MTKEYSYGAVVYRYKNRRLEILIEHMKLGHTSIPKGHIEAGETPLECTKREIKEETNLTVKIDQTFSHKITYSPKPDVIKDVVFYLATPTSKKIIPQKIEVTSIEWVSPDKAIESVTFDSDKETLKLAIAEIIKRHGHKRTKAQISYNMSRIKGKNTSIEKKLRKALYQEGYRYFKNDKKLPGKPDIVLTKFKIAIFCDGDFFHGYDLSKTESQIKTNSAYWDSKIEKNRQRDRLNDEKLVEMGYLVLHFWEHEINEDIGRVLHEIENTVLKRKIELNKVEEEQ